MVYEVFLINLKEDGQQVDPNLDGGTVWYKKVQDQKLGTEVENREDWMRSIKEAKVHIGL
jgi:hypothetical protein